MMANPYRPDTPTVRVVPGAPVWSPTELFSAIIAAMSNPSQNHRGFIPVRDKDDLRPPPSRYSEGEHDLSRMQYPRPRRDGEGRDTVMIGRQTQICAHCGRPVTIDPAEKLQDEIILLNGPRDGIALYLPFDMSDYHANGAHYARTKYKDEKGRVIYTYVGPAPNPTSNLQTK
jgi:hypothetical protein